MSYADLKEVTCGNPIVGKLIGCCRGVSGLMHDEHSILCTGFTNQSPQRIAMIAAYTASQMMSGEQIIHLNYKKEACFVMKIDEIQDDNLFFTAWDSFVKKTREEASVY
jgi:hypothetical protein